MKNKKEKNKKEIEHLLKAIKNKPKKLNCVATEKCQINLSNNRETKD